jgi:hypothetical protein
MKIFITLFLFSLLLFSSEIQIDAKIFPAIVKYDLKLKEKLIDGKIKISILYREDSQKKAKRLERLILRKYSPTIDLISEKEIFSKLKNTTAIYLFDLDYKYIEYVVQYAKKRSILTFSNNPSLLQYGVMTSILNKRRVRPVLNREAIRSSGISLSSTLLKVSFIYEE